MKSFISEDDIEQAFITRLKNDHRWEHIACDPSPEAKDDPGPTGRASVKECILPEVLRAALRRLNPRIPDEQLGAVFAELRKDFSGEDMTDVNCRLYNRIRNGIKVKLRVGGKDDFDFVRLMDFGCPANNTFTVVNQMWIRGHYNYRRPDVLLFVNGLPVVFIELKNSTVKVSEAYAKNLVSYRKDIPNVFAFNQICVLSNGLETRLGAFSAGYEFFFEWLKANGEKDEVNREGIAEHGMSVQLLIDGLFRKERLLDYIENFVFFDHRRIKIIAKNHQYHGVNNLMRAMERREELKGKLGVFWHTQGSGKSYSMVMFVRKVRRKLSGNFTFLVVTDRDDLDVQIHKTFVRSEVIGPKEECQPKNSEQLREYLSCNKPMVFTLIHKFGWDATKGRYPLLSDRNDIVVLVDEAHRTQYKQLAENMHAGIPNANYIAFTGTPLLGAKRLTNQWFGDYVSEYNFAQAVEDGSTVPIFYSRRVPEVWLANNFLDDDVVDIIEEERLNDRERQLLENSSSQIVQVIKRDDRLDKIARDIAHHFPRRGFLGKGMVVSVDKETAQKMLGKVRHYWSEEQQKLVEERNAAATKRERDELTMRIDWMGKVEMDVVLCDMEEKIVDGKDVEDRFKDPNDNLRLVFVCAMWLTGFDVPSLSTLYLDKPMKSHTLMQAIARVNRVYPGKTCGMVVDYVNVFKFMRQALADYAQGNDAGEFPAKDIGKLVELIEQCVGETEGFLRTLDFDLDEVLRLGDAFETLEAYREVYDRILAHDDTKTRFRVLTNTLMSLYEASKPEIFERGWQNRKFAAIRYLHGIFCNQIDDEKIRRARERMTALLDTSVRAAATNREKDCAIHQGKVIDLSKIDVGEIRKAIRETAYKALEIDDLRAFIEKALHDLINRNCTRLQFSERYRGIIDRYNAGGSENEDYYEQLLKLMEDLRKEQGRATESGLTEEELEIFDLLIQGRRLTQKEEQRVKLAAKNLYQKLSAAREELLVVDWFKDEQTKEKVYTVIQEVLNEDLPESYDKPIFDAKTDLLLSHFVDMAVQGYGWVSVAA